MKVRLVHSTPCASPQSSRPYIIIEVDEKDADWLIDRMRHWPFRGSVKAANELRKYKQELRIWKLSQPRGVR